MYSLIEDLASITTLPISSLQKLCSKSIFCICNCIEEDKLKNESLTEINIGIGNLQINNINNNIQYRFIPNKKFEEAIRTTLIDGKNPLTDALEESLVNKILHAYKDLL